MYILMNMIPVFSSHDSHIKENVVSEHTDHLSKTFKNKKHDFLESNKSNIYSFLTYFNEV